MKTRKLLFLLSLLFASAMLHAQLSLTKVVGKNAGRYKLGYNVFSFYDFPLNDAGNKSVRLELLDFAIYPGKETLYDRTNASSYISIKLGYKNIFSETRTGFYLEPSFGYSRVLIIEPYSRNEKDYGDGIAAAVEGGYNLEVGNRGHALALGIKYETDRAGAAYILNSVGARLSYSFNLARRSN